MPEEDDVWDYIRPVVVAVVVVLLLLTGMYLYTGNWPPLVVVESGSMQHSSSYAYLGDLNIGDVVMVKKVTSSSQVRTYIDGEASGYSTYGEFGNVIIYRPYGSYSTTPIIHRAIVYIEYNTTGGGYDVPSLSRLPASQWYVLTPAGKSHDVYNIRYNIVINDVGYTHGPVIIPISNFVGRANYSGFITMGDHNHALYGENATDQALGIFPVPVKAQWLNGIAVGELPYVGLIKLELSGGLPAGTPSNSVYALVVILTAIVTVPIASEMLWSYWKENWSKGSKEKKRKEGSD